MRFVVTYEVIHAPVVVFVSYLIRMMTEGVWAIAPIMLHTHITHRKVRKAC